MALVKPAALRTGEEVDKGYAMGSSREYWEHARECARWAAEAKTTEDHNILLEMAKAWTNIALVESDIARQVLFEGRVTKPPHH
jgi:hypothetical protein